MMDKDYKLRNLFGIPDFIDDPGLFLTAEDRELLLSLDGKPLSEDSLDPSALKDLYRRAVLDKTEEAGGQTRYRTGNFYHFISALIVTDSEKLSALPEDLREKLKSWYFHQYYDWLVENGADRGALTEDRVLTLDEAVSFLRETELPVFLTDCECRLFYHNCERPIRLCLSLGCAPNSPGDRGYAVPVTKEEAVETVREADRAGLMHTLSAMGICSCCGDCCCMFQSQKKMGCYGIWPVSAHRIHMDPSVCVNCGACLSRCHLGVFSKDPESGRILCDPAACAGCGLCVNTCPSGALRLVSRP